jgi:uncharacterized protein DUF1996
LRRWLTLLLVAVAAAIPAAVAVAAATAAPQHGGGGGGGGHGGGFRGYFAIACGFSHRNQDDPIVFFNQPGRSHDHTYFGNEATNASSTPDSLRAAGQTSCRLRADTAAYWAPTLLANGRAVEPTFATVYYIRRTVDAVQPFPANLKMIAGSSAARTAQGVAVTSWSCTRSRVRASTTIPTCSAGSAFRSNLQLQVNFPNCWDGSRLDSANHQSHMAYSSDGVCPVTHPVEVPALTILIRYPVSGAGAELSSGGQFSGHADFVNAWDQDKLARLVDRYLNRGR